MPRHANYLYCTVQYSLMGGGERAAKQRTRGKDHSYEAPNRQANAYSEPGPIPGVPRPVILQNQTKVETIHDQKKQMSAI